VKPTVPEVLPLVKAIYARNCVGCCLHIILDDDNTEQHHAEFCLKYAQEHGHPDCIELAQKLVQMSRTQRHKLYQQKY
jgi:hypothetical protein